MVDDALETPLAGVTVRFLGKDGSGHTTTANATTVSDASGNFQFTNLPASYVGPQLIQYDGTTATSPPGTYSGVDLVYTIQAGQVTTSPILIHLPRIDNAETVMVQQNAALRTKPSPLQRSQIIGQSLRKNDISRSQMVRSPIRFR